MKDIHILPLWVTHCSLHSDNSSPITCDSADRSIPVVMNYSWVILKHFNWSWTFVLKPIKRLKKHLRGERCPSKLNDKMIWTYPNHPWVINDEWGPSWSWSYGSWIYNYLYNTGKYLSPLKLRVRTPLRRGVLDTTLCDKVCQLLATGR